VLLLSLWIPNVDGFATFWIAVWVSAIVHHARRQSDNEIIGAMASSA